jgi:hypothetical protein
LSEKHKRKRKRKRKRKGNSKLSFSVFLPNSDQVLIDTRPQTLVLMSIQNELKIVSENEF